MNNIQLLLELQSIDLKIKNLNKELEKMESFSDIENCKKKLDICLENKNNLSEEVLKKEETILKLNSQLKDEYFNLEFNNEELYSGKITDLKKLESLNEENSRLKNLVSDLESSYLVEIDKLEILKSELNLNKKNIKDLKSKIEKKEEKIERTLRSLDSDLSKLKDEREKILLDLDESVLRLYKSLSKRSKFIVKIDGDRCLGCNMILPIYIREKVNNKDIVQCENCDRILYK